RIGEPRPATISRASKQRSVATQLHISSQASLRGTRTKRVSRTNSANRTVSMSAYSTEHGLLKRSSQITDSGWQSKRSGWTFRLARERGTKRQQLRCAYNRAWTQFWWYEDFRSFSQTYDDVEELAKGSGDTSDLELLQNLWQLLYPAAMSGQVPQTTAHVDE